MRKYKLILYSFKDVYVNGRAFFWIYIFKAVFSTMKIYMSAWLSKILLNDIVNGITAEEITHSLIGLVLLVVFIDVVHALVDLVTDYYSEKSAIKYSNALTIKNAKKCSRLKYQYHDNPVDKDAVKQFMSDGRSAINVYCQTVNLVLAVVSFIASLVIGLRFSIFITVISLLAAFPAFFIRKKNQNAGYKLEKELNLTDRVIDYFKSVCTGQSFYKEIHLFGVTSFFFDKLKTFLELRTDKNVKLRKAKMFREFLLLIVFSTVNIVINLSIIAFIIIKQLTIGDYTFYTTIINTLKNNSDSLVASTNDLIISLSRVQNYLDFYNDDKNEYELGTMPVPSIINKIEFSNVYFKYPNTEEYVLKNVTFEVNFDEKVALAGTNGAGKSTIINLLLRFYDPDSGTILLNGCDIRYYNLEEYWSKFACMLQNSNLYDITLRENLLLGNIPKLHNINNETLCSFLSMLGLSMSSNDMERQVNKQFDQNGLVFSPGQMQKLNVVRTLLAYRPVMILDEPSSSMDAITENAIVDTIFSSLNNQMLFFISHRLSNMKKVNKIVFLENGEVREIGSHNDLMNLQGKYAELFEKQAFNFIETC